MQKEGSCAENGSMAEIAEHSDVHEVSTVNEQEEGADGPVARSSFVSQPEGLQILSAQLLISLQLRNLIKENKEFRKE
ncbi:hypothetical protein GJAV_G00095610 [Gymnothorax javanicus]|nr:hypothetical protein GJAV_G00095610 [Gymnothorax javanicus]